MTRNCTTASMTTPDELNAAVQTVPCSYCQAQRGRACDGDGVHMVRIGAYRHAVRRAHVEAVAA